MGSVLLLLAALLTGCNAENTSSHQAPASALQQPSYPEHPNAATIATRFPPPNGYTRTEATPSSFAHFLRHVSLKPHGSPVLLHDGSPKRNQSAHAAVLTLDVGTRDLQQCADAVMRLRAECLFAQRRLNDIHFNFTSGFRADFSRWAKGERIRISGNNATWVKSAGPDASHKSLREFLDVVYSYAGTRSLEKELVPVSLAEIQAGDVFIRGGSPGHAVIVVDVARSSAGKKVFLLAQSYMPAQDIHVLKNPANEDGSPWYAVEEIGEVLETPEWEFGVRELRRFAGE